MKWYMITFSCLFNDTQTSQGYMVIYMYDEVIKRPKVESWNCNFANTDRTDLARETLPKVLDKIQKNVNKNT